MRAVFHVTLVQLRLGEWRGVFEWMNESVLTSLQCRAVIIDTLLCRPNARPVMVSNALMQRLSCDDLPEKLWSL